MALSIGGFRGPLSGAGGYLLPKGGESGDIAPPFTPIEIFAQEFPKALTHFSTLGGMAVGGLAFRVARFTALGLAGRAGLAILGTGPGGRLYSATVGTLVETPVFNGVARMLDRMAGGPSDLVHDAYWKEFAATATMLASLRVFGFAGHQALTLAKGRPSAAWVIPAAFQMGGLHYAHQIQKEFGWTDPRLPDPTAADHLASLAQFNGMAVLIRSALGRRWTALERSLDIQMERCLHLPSLDLGPHRSLAFNGPVRAIMVNEPDGMPRDSGYSQDPVVSSPRLPEFIGHRTKSIARSIEAAVRHVPSEGKYLFLDVIGEPIPEIDGVLKRLLQQRIHLQEIRVKFLDGGGILAGRTGQGVRVQSFNLSEGDLFFSNPGKPSEEIYRYRIFSPWESKQREKLFTHDWMRALREQNGLSRAQVVERLMDPGDPNLKRELRHYWGANKTVSEFSFEKLENPSRVSGLAFPFLRRLAGIYRVDVRRLIGAMNRRRFPQVPEEYWSTRDYPIYLEDKLDLQRIRYYQEAPTHQSVGSFGWLVWSLRKNPFNYFTTVDLAEALGITSETLVRWDTNRNFPQNPETMLPRLAGILQVPERILKEALHRTVQEGSVPNSAPISHLEIPNPGEGGVQGHWLKFLQSKSLAVRPVLSAPEFFTHQTNSLARAVEAAVRSAPPECKCLFIDVVGEELKTIGERLIPVLAKKPGLEEIRLRFLDGTLTWVARVEGEIKFSDGNMGWVSYDKMKIITERESLPENDPIFLGTDREPGEILRMRLFGRWQRFNDFTPPLGPYLRRLRGERGLSLPEVFDALRHDRDVNEGLKGYRHKSFSESTLRRWEKPGNDSDIPFPLLKGLAKLYQVDIRRLVMAANRANRPEVSLRYWARDLFPVYLEGKEDQVLMDHYRQEPSHRGVGSFGWLLWSSRKDPFRYLSSVQLAKELGYHHNIIKAWERNEIYPEMPAIQAIAKLLRISEAQIIFALNRTFYPDLPVEQLFPGLPIPIHARHDDIKKIQSYAENPGSLGQWLFATRKIQPGSPGSNELSRRLGKNEDYLHVREWNAVKLEPQHVHPWVQLFRSLDVPLELLKATLEERHGIPQDDSVYFLAESLRGRTLDGFSDEAMVARDIVQDLSQGRLGKVKPATILHLKEALPQKDWARIYRERYPEIQEVFPESRGDAPYLAVSPAFMESALLDFNLAERLFAFRMNPPPGLPPGAYLSDGTVPQIQAAKAFGISAEAWGNYEHRFTMIQQDRDLIRLADGLGVDPRLIYLHFRPEVLRIFPIRDRETDMAWSLDAKEGAQLMVRVNQNYSRSNMRRKLAPVVTRLLREHGGQNPRAVLARALGASPGQAQKYLAEDRWLNPGELRRLSDRLEQFSYSEWYEHFNRAPLSYFLGRLPSGDYDYRPGAIQNLPEQARASARFDDITPDARINLKNILRLLGEGRITYNSIGFLSRQTGIPAREIYLWSRRGELGPMIEATRSEP